MSSLKKPEIMKFRDERLSQPLHDTSVWPLTVVSPSCTGKEVAKEPSQHQTAHMDSAAAISMATDNTPDQKALELEARPSISELGKSLAPWIPLLLPLPPAGCLKIWENTRSQFFYRVE